MTAKRVTQFPQHGICNHETLDYIIAHGTDTNELWNNIKKYYEKGYDLHGSLVIIPNKQIMLAQAMVKTTSFETHGV